MVVTFGLCHCNVSSPGASTLPEHHNSPTTEDFTTFQVGDWFEMKRPMFLIDDSSDGKMITKPGQNAPLVEDFLATGGKLPHPPYEILRFLPKGTRIKVVSIKNPGNMGPTPYFYLAPEYPLVYALFRESWSLDSEYDRAQLRKWHGNRRFGEKVKFVVDYQRDYFRKVE